MKSGAEFDSVLVARILENVEGSVDALVIFGSAARGEMDSLSDVDILQIGGHPKRRYMKGNLEYSVYSSIEFEKLAKLKSLFVDHICREGVTLVDSNGWFERLTTNFEPATSYEELIESLKTASKMVAPLSRSTPDEISIQCNVSYFLLRSAMFARLFNSGLPCYSVRNAAKYFQIQEVLTLRHQKRTGHLDEGFLKSCNQLLSQMLSVDIFNSRETIEAAIVSSFGEPNSDLAIALGLRILAGHDVILPYEMIGIWKSIELQ